MAHKPEIGRDLEIDLADIVKFFQELENHDRERSQKQSSEEIVMQVLREDQRDSQKKPQIDENPLDGRDRFSGVLEVIAWLVEDMEPAEQPESSEGDSYGDDRNQEIVHQKYHELNSDECSVLVVKF